MEYEWFKRRIGQTILRTDPDGHQTYFEIENKADAEYAHSLQASGFSFSDGDDDGSSDNVCIACEG